MHVRIHSLAQTFFDGNARSVTIPTTSGEITVLPHHRSLISELREGMIRIINETNADVFVPVATGFVEVNKEGVVSVLVD